MANASAAAPAASKPKSPTINAASAVGSDVKYDFSGRLALVTGSTQGIGYAIALAYVRSGADVVVNGRDQKKVDAAVAKLQGEAKLLSAPNAKQRIVGATGDVGTAAGCAAIAKAALAIGAIDFLVLNASITGNMKPFLEADDDEWMHLYSVNVLSLVRLGRILLPDMVKRNAHGRLIVTSSCAAYGPTSGMLSYSATKAAQTNIVKGLAEATKGTTVTVNSLAVGITLTEGLEAACAPLIGHLNATRAAAGQPAGATIADAVDVIIKTGSPHLPLQRGIAPDEVAAAAMYISSKGAITSNGAGLRVDGGLMKDL